MLTPGTMALAAKLCRFWKHKRAAIEQTVAAEAPSDQSFVQHHEFSAPQVDEHTSWQDCLEAEATEFHH